MRLILTTIAGLALSLALTGAQAPQPSIEGSWKSPGGNSIIAIAPCGTAWCGTVQWASDKAKQDSRKTVEQLVGTQLLTGVQQKSPGRWQGKLFIPDKNMRVTAKLQLVGDQQLRVSGCALGKSLCKADVWTRTDGASLPPAG
jgi:uncharacterized protein (DUF2147 family)